MSFGVITFSGALGKPDCKDLRIQSSGEWDARTLLAWKGGSRTYEAKYGGTFVRRSAKLKGTQTWMDGGKTVTRACAGAIKRPLKAFLPREKK